MRQFGGAGQGVQTDKTKVLIGLGLVFFLFALTAVFFLYSSSGSVEASAPVAANPATANDSDSVKMVKVLVPVRKIDPGTPLEPSMFREQNRPMVGLAGARIVKDFEEIKGRYARSLILSDQPLQLEFITNVRPTNALTPNIPEGFRAVTISVDARSSVEGFVLPGSKVDVVWASSIRNKPGVTVIVQNAKVLSAERKVNSEAAPEGPVPSTVTLLVTTEDAAKIQLASTTGSLTLSLRGDNDVGKGGSGRSITVDDLLGLTNNGDNANSKRGPEVVIGGQKFILDEGGKLKPSTGN